MDNAVIRSTLETRLASAAGALNLPVFWENWRTSEEPSGPHLRTYLLPATTRSPFLRGEGWLFSGMFQVSIFAPSGQGAAYTDVVARALCEAFTCPQRFPAANAGWLELSTPPAVGAARVEPDWYMVPVSIRYLAYGTRPATG